MLQDQIVDARREPRRQDVAIVTGGYTRGTTRLRAHQYGVTLLVPTQTFPFMPHIASLGRAETPE